MLRRCYGARGADGVGGALDLDGALVGRTLNGMDSAQLAIPFTAPPTAAAWNPRYVAFARAHGHTPDEQKASDEDRWPGGKMTGFIVWISVQWKAWRAGENAKDGERRNQNYVPWPEDHVAFDARLAALGPCAGCEACEARADS